MNVVDESGVQMTPLHWASKKGHTEVVLALMGTTGININSADKNGRTPLHWAIRKGQDEVVQALVAAPDIAVNLPDMEGDTALHIASMLGNSDVVKALLEAPGIRVFAVNNEGNTALDLAWNVEAAEALQEAVTAKRAFGTMLLALRHGGIAAEAAVSLAWRSLGGGGVREMAEHMCTTWPCLAEAEN